MRLIDADALEKFLKRLRRELPKESRDFFTRDEMILNFQQYVHMQHTISAVPVVRGEWICNPDDEKFSLVCSVCGQVMPFVPEYLPDNPPFCNCGADMRRESEGST